MGTRRVPKYRHFKPKNLGVVRLDRRDHYLGRYESPESLEKYHRLVAEWLSREQTRPAAASHPSTAAEPLTVSDVILRYWNFAKSYYVKGGRPTSEQDCIRSALRPLRKLYGQSPAQEFGPVALKAVRDEMVRCRLSRMTVNKHVGRIRRMYAWAVEQELLPVAVHQALSTVPGLRRGRTEARETAGVGPVDDQSVDAILPFLSPVLRAMVEFQRLTGCRPGEVCGLRPADLERSGDVWCYRPPTHKTIHHGRSRRIFVGPRAQAVLRPYLDREPERFCFDPREAGALVLAGGTGAPSATSQSGRGKGVQIKRRRPRFDKDSYRAAIAKACVAAGIAVWSPNRLRHARAPTIRQQYGLEAAQTVLGHARADVTQIYAERDDDLARRIMRENG